MDAVIERLADLRSVLAAGFVAASFFIHPAAAHASPSPDFAVAAFRAVKFDAATTTEVKAGDEQKGSVAERVKKVVVAHLKVKPEKVVDGANFKNDLGADDLDEIELNMALEEEFGIEIPDAAAKRIRTVGDAVTYLEKATAR
jgi:acyl carrier protein